MHGEEGGMQLSVRQLLTRLAVMVGVGVAAGVIGGCTVFDVRQAAAVAVFLSISLGTLFFWNFRLAIAFLGLSVLICTHSLNIQQFVQSSALEVILFLVGMMIIVGALRDLGFFSWIVQCIVSMPNISGGKFIVVTSAASALLACAVDEVTSIIFISTLIFQVCDRLKLNPTPYVIIAVLCTNIGSAGTMMGNPVGIYIGTKGGLTFGDFMTWAFPLMLLALASTVAVTYWYFRREVALFNEHLQARLARNLSLASTVDVPYVQGLVLLLATVLAIASHHQIESWLGLGKNSVLLIAPLACSGVVMIIRRDRARHYVERDVDWWTLLFFMLLFAIAGTLEHTHVDRIMASRFAGICGTEHAVLVPFILAVTAMGSAFVDNVIFVAAFCPVIEQLAVNVKDLPLWWALLFGACFGGNITMIGSTANIVALGMLEKRAHTQVGFFQWLKIGFLSALLACVVAWAGLMLLEPWMPDRHVQLKYEYLTADSGKVFHGKNAMLKARCAGPASLPALPDFPAADYEAFWLSPSSGGRGPAVPVLVPKTHRELIEALEAADDNVLMLQGKVHTMAAELPESPHLFVLEAVSPAAVEE